MINIRSVQEHFSPLVTESGGRSEEEILAVIRENYGGLNLRMLGKVIFFCSRDLHINIKGLKFLFFSQQEYIKLI